MQAIGRLVMENRAVDRNWDKPKTWVWYLLLHWDGHPVRPHLSHCINFLLQRSCLFRIWASATGCSGLVRITHDSRNQKKTNAKQTWFANGYCGAMLDPSRSQITCFTMFRTQNNNNNCKHTSQVSGAPWLRAPPPGAWQNLRKSVKSRENRGNLVKWILPGSMPPAGGHGKICENLWTSIMKTMEILENVLESMQIIRMPCGLAPCPEWQTTYASEFRHRLLKHERILFDFWKCATQVWDQYLEENME